MSAGSEGAGSGLTAPDALGWSALTWGSQWPKHLLGVRERVWSATFRSPHCVPRPGPLSRLRQEELRVRANYNKEQHPGSHFLEVKGKLDRQEMPAQRNQNLRQLLEGWLHEPGPWVHSLTNSAQSVLGSDQPPVISHIHELFAPAIHCCAFSFSIHSLFALIT